MLDKPLAELKDADGKLFIKECIDVASTKGKGKGWIDYITSSSAGPKTRADSGWPW